LTLVFLGEVAEAHGAVAVERFRTPLPLGPFRIGLGGPGLFPASGRPRVLWLAVSEGTAALASVRTAVEARLEGIPYARDPRVFSPHLTLGRFRDGGTLDDRGTVARSLVADSGTAVVDLVTLCQSRLSPRGPEHTALATSSLVSVEGT
jgi:2'-5' RNA ligase